MNFGEIRTKFIDLSGRFDLADSMESAPYSDGGADFFIASGQRYLDNSQLHPKSLLRYQKDIVAGTYGLEFKDALSVKEVWFTTSSERKSLSKVGFGWMNTNFTYPPSDHSAGTPKYYSTNIIGLAGQQDALTTANYTGDFTRERESIHFADEASNTSHQYYRGIIFLPPNDTAGTITVYGNFKAKALSLNADENFWSVQYPDLLIQAANYSLESFYRNTEGAKDWKVIIDETLRGIDYNLVEETISGINQMQEEVETINEHEEMI